MEISLNENFYLLITDKVLLFWRSSTTIISDLVIPADSAWLLSKQVEESTVNAIFFSKLLACYSLPKALILKNRSHKKIVNSENLEFQVAAHYSLYFGILSH